jgi:hypothetical protein
MSPGLPLRPGAVAGELLELEGWYYIEDFDVCAESLVTGRQPSQDIGGVYRPGGCGFDGVGDFGPEHPAFLADATVLDDAEIDFAHDGAYFARDLRIAPVRDTTGPRDLRDAPKRPALPATMRAFRGRSLEGRGHRKIAASAVLAALPFRRRPRKKSISPAGFDRRDFPTSIRPV